MDKYDDRGELARGIADGIKKLQPFDRNIAAMMTAQLLSDGKSKCELNETIHFLQLIILSIKTYTNC